MVPNHYNSFMVDLKRKMMRKKIAVDLWFERMYDRHGMSLSKIKGDESMSESERKCFILGL